MVLSFDVSKIELVGVLINKRGEIKESYTIPNEKESIERFLDETLSKYQKVKAGSEATGEYHNVLAQCCLEKEIPFYLLNPIVTKQFTRATVRKKKTDLTDAQIIGKCILQDQGQLISPSIFNPVKPLLRTLSQLSRIAVALSHMEKRFKDNFPEQSLMQKELRRISADIGSTVKRVRLKALEKTDPIPQSLLSSIPGIGKTLAAVFIAEIGDIKRFKSQKSLIAYAGLDPKVRQSGYTLKRNTHLTKRGSPYLRRAAYLAASIAQRHDLELRAYHQKKRNEGKRYKEATIANARHILNRIYAIWKRGTPYVKPCKSINVLSIPEKVLT